MTQGDLYWRRFTELAGRPEWLADPRFATLDARSEHRAELTRAIEELMAERDLAEWARLLDAHGLLWAPVAELPEVIADPQHREMGVFTTIEDPALGSFETIAAPFQLEGADIEVRGPAPAAGQHTHEVLRELGLRDDEIADLAERRVFG